MVTTLDMGRPVTTCDDLERPGRTGDDLQRHMTISEKLNFDAKDPPAALIPEIHTLRQDEAIEMGADPSNQTKSGPLGWRRFFYPLSDSLMNMWVKALLYRTINVRPYG